MKIFILFVVFHVNSGSVLHTQEFNSLAQCDYVAGILKKYSSNVGAFCVEK